MGNTYEKDGALWLATEKFGDDKDRVIIKSDGEGAYLSGDLAYYLDKRERGFDRCFIMLGADHHGYVARMMAMCAAFGDTPHVNLEILIGQLVNLLKDGQPMRMSKRAGTVVAIDDLVEAIGVDASRYALARYSSDSPIDIDLDLWTKASSENPVYYVQYVHARTSSILRNAGELGARAGVSTTTFDPSLLAHEKEGELLRALAEFPRVVAAAAELREPHRVARYLEDTAGSYHRFYDNCRVLPMGDEDPTDLNRARLMLVEATRVVFANGLALLGVSAHPKECDGPDDPRSRLGPRTRRPARAVVAARTRRPQRPGPTALVVDGTQGRRRPDRRGSGAGRPGRGVQHPGVRPRRGRLQDRGPGRSATRSRRTTCSTPARRSSAPRSPSGSRRRG